MSDHQSYREPRWDADAEIGRQGEIFVTDIISSLTAGASREVKNDLVADRTGNVYVEYACRRADGWADSGIKTSEAEFTVFVLGGQSALVVPTGVLRLLARRAYLAGRRVEEKDGSHPTRGVVIPLRDFPLWTREATLL